MKLNGRQTLKQTMKQGQSIGFYLLLIIGLFLVYYPSLQQGFTYLDDHVQVVENLSIRSLDLHSTQAIFTGTSVGMYQPFTTFIYAIIFHFFELDSFYYHLSSLLFHLLNSILVLRLLKYFFSSKKLIFFLTLVFAFHPMQVESVSWVSAFSNLCSTFFFLAALLNYLTYSKTKHQRSYFFALVLFILACFSKSSAVVFPVIVFLIEISQGKKITAVWKDKIPFLLLSIAFGIITLLSRESAGHLSDLSINFNAFDRIFLISHSILFYPFTFLLPIKLSAFYPYPELVDGSLPLSYYLSPFLLLALLFLVYRFRANQKIWLGAAFYFVGIALVLQIIPVGNQITTDRYIYLPMIGLLLILGNLLHQLRNHKAFYLLFLIPFLFGYMSQKRSAIWENDEQLWKSVIEEYPNVSQAYNNLGSYALESNHPQEAFRYFNKAIQLQPNYADAYSNRGNLYSQSGKSAKAIQDFSKAISLKEHADAYFNRGNEFSKVGDLNSAIADYSKSLALVKRTDTYTNRAFAYLKAGKVSLAKDDLKLALQINPKEDRAIFLSGLVERNLGNIEKACSFFQKAMTFGNQNAKAAFQQSCR